jgi:hypothetical protein
MTSRTNAFATGIRLAVLALAGWCSPASAGAAAEPAPPENATETQTEKAPRKFVNTVPGAILYGTGFLAANAGLATLNPKVYGALLGLGVPIVALGMSASEGTRDKSDPLLYSGMFAAYGAYHYFELGKDKYTSKQVFVRNLAATVVFSAVGAGLASGRRKRSENPVAFNYTPLRGGGVLQMEWHVPVP